MKYSTRWALCCALGVGLAVRFFLSFYVHPGMNWDEAPQALLARYISEGRLWPIVHFQLPYIGAVEQYPLALFMLVFGDSVSSLRGFYFAVSALSLGGAYWLYQRVLPYNWAVVATAMFALCLPIVLLSSLMSYSFAGLVLCTSIVLSASYSEKVHHSTTYLLLLGLVCGLALYNNVLFIGILLYCSWSVLQENTFKNKALFGLGIGIGYSPMLYFNLRNDFVSYKLLVSKFLRVTQAMVDEMGVFNALFMGITLKFSGEGSGFVFTDLFSYPRFDNGVGYWLQWSGLVVLCALIAGSFTTLLPRWYASNSMRKSYPRHKTFAFYITAGLVLFISLSEIRYLTAVAPIAPIMICDSLVAIERRAVWVARSVALFVLSYLCFVYGAAIVQYAASANERESYEDIYQILVEEELTFGYGSYQFQSSIAFISKGQIKISPQIGPIFLDKIPAYSQQVDQARDVFYILPQNREYLQYLDQWEISYQLQEVGQWWIAWGFSERVYPKDLLPEYEITKTGGYLRWSYRENPAVLNVFRGGH